MRKENIIAFIPASGLGKRLWPITKFVPKEMFPVGNKPLIHYLIENIAASGIREVVIGIRPAKHIIRDYLKDGHAFGVRIKYTTGSPVGIDQTIRQAERYLKRGPFLLAVADLFITDPTVFREVLRLYHEHNASIDVLVRDSHNHFPSFAVPIDKKIAPHLSDIRAYVTRPKYARAPLVSIGISLLTPSFLHHLPKGKQARETSYAKCVNSYMREERRIGWETSTRIFDCSTPQGLIAATNFVLQSKIKRKSRVGRLVPRQLCNGL